MHSALAPVLTMPTARTLGLICACKHFTFSMLCMLPSLAGQLPAISPLSGSTVSTCLPLRLKVSELYCCLWPSICRQLCCQPSDRGDSACVGG